MTRSLREASRQASQVIGIDLSDSDELRCVNLMCEHVGERCACRLALWFHRHEFPRMRTLILRGNDLRTVPEPICQLQNLIELDLSNNRLEEIPESFARLSNLEKLDLRGNMKIRNKDS